MYLIQFLTIKPFFCSWACWLETQTTWLEDRLSHDVAECVNLIIEGPDDQKF